MQIGRISGQLVGGQHQLHGIRHIDTPDAPLYFGVDAHVYPGGIQDRAAVVLLQFRRGVTLHALMQFHGKASVVLTVLPGATDDVQSVRIVASCFTQVASHRSDTLHVEKSFRNLEEGHIVLASVVTHHFRQFRLLFLNSYCKIIQAIRGNDISRIPRPFAVAATRGKVIILVTQTFPSVENSADGSNIFGIWFGQIGFDPGRDHCRARPWKLHTSTRTVPVGMRVAIEIAGLLITDVVIPEPHGILL